MTMTATAQTSHGTSPHPLLNIGIAEPNNYNIYIYLINRIYIFVCMNIDNRARIMGQDRPTITGLCFEHELKSSWQWEVGNGLARLDSCIDVLQPWFV